MYRLNTQMKNEKSSKNYHGQILFVCLLESCCEIGVARSSFEPIRYLFGCGAGDSGAAMKQKKMKTEFFRYWFSQHGVLEI